MAKSKKTGSHENMLREPAAVYYAQNRLRPNATAIALSLQDNYIKRSVSLMGMANVRAFAAIENLNDFIERIREGVPKKALDNLIDVTGISASEVPSIIHTSDRTLRRYSDKQKLSATQSERVIEIAKLYSRGEEVFGSLDNFKDWMNSTVVALGNKKPKDFLDTSLGIDMLMNELGRIEHGIFA